MNINVTIIGQAITFALLILFTMKFVWPPLNKMLEDRAEKISSGLVAAEKGNQVLVDAKAKISEEMHKMQARANEIIANSQKRADQLVQEAKDIAHKEADRIISDAKTQIEQEVLRAKEELRNKVSALAIKGAERILKAEINEAKQAALLADIKAEL